MSVGEELVAYWKLQPRLAVRPPAGIESITAFERDHSVQLPNDIKDYFLHADGFDQFSQNMSAQDRNGFTFYPIETLVAIPNYQGGQFAFPGSEEFYLFADYLAWCWAYAVRINAAGGDSVVVLVGTETGEPREIAPTFARFAELYIKDDPRLYGS